MKTGTIVWMGWLALALLTNAHAAPRTFDIALRADVVIAADGTVETLEWQDKRQGNRLLNAKVEPLVWSWHFKPATVDGEPAPSQTQLDVQVLGVEQADGSVALRLGTVSTGPRSGAKVVPRFPPNAARAGVSAEVAVVISIGIDGVSTVESNEFHGQGKSFRSEFLASAESAAKGWTFELERVAGRPVPAKVRMHFQFCAPADSWCARRSSKTAEASAGASDARRGDAVPLNSVVQLLTQVGGQEI